MLSSAGIKHQGRKRAHNEDSFLVDDVQGLYAVADGVESEPFGEVASEMAVTSLAEVVKGLRLDDDATPPFEYAQGIPLEARALKFAFREVNRRVHERSKSESKLSGMCTTLAAVWTANNRAFIASVGDSRVYLIRQGQIQQLTRDHTTLAQGDSQPARIDFLEHFTSSSEHELTRVIGVNPDIEVQLAAGSPKPGDIFVLCTDGLYEDIRDFEIMDTVKAYPPDTAVKKLVQVANERGGKDNVAVVVVKFG